GLTYPDILTADEKAAAEDAGMIASSGPRTDDPADAVEAAEDETEYLRISPERLSAISKPQQGKKEKPKFSHTCTRCGKTWDMPIRLDPTKPMYCAECLPLMKEERKVKKAVLKAVTTGPIEGNEAIVVQDARPANEEATRKLGSALGSVRSDDERKKPNRPRLVGDRKPLPDAGGGSVKVVRGGDEGHVSLMDELKRAKGKDIETDKRKLGAGPQKKTRGGDIVGPSEAEAGDASAPRSSTVFRKTLSSVRQDDGSMKPLVAGQHVAFDGDGP
ncbi:hypothetical protein L0Y59_02415, partial [Candidatus Uhrbacteria bacterium]|nr:hypothetical protein [Candidatus Uhrbacteria bacterium]